MATESSRMSGLETSESPAGKNGPQGSVYRASRGRERTQHHLQTSDQTSRARVQKFSREESTYSYSCPGIWSGAAMELR